VEKRLPLALFLSFLVLFGWMYVFGEKDVPPEREGTGTFERTDPEPGDPGKTTATGGGTEPGETPVVEEGTEPGSEMVPTITEEEPRTIEVLTGPADAENGESHPGRYSLVFSNRGGRLVGAKFRDYVLHIGQDSSESENWLPLLEPVDKGDGTETGSLLLDLHGESKALVPGGLSEVLWQMERIEGNEPGARFTYAPGNGLVFRKEITAVPGSWHLRLVVTIENEGRIAGDAHTFELIPAGCVPAELGDRFYQEPRAVAVGVDEDNEFSMDWESASGADDGGDTLDVGSEQLVFAGGHNKYFAFFLRQSNSTERTMRAARYDPWVEPTAAVAGEDPKEYVEATVLLELDVPSPGASRSWEYTIFAGPKDPDIIVGDHKAHRLVLDKDLSFFSSIGRVLLAIMGFFHGLVGNWGAAIILLTICVRAVLFPLNRRSQTAMARYQKKMKRVQPKMEEIKQRYANDAQKQREAQAKLMQEEGAFPPLGGCLPIFLQIPIFFGLFSALRTSFDLRQAPFALWIDDLSLPDRLLRLDLEIPLGFTTFDLTYLNLLPLLMVVLWILQQKGMPQPQDEQAKRMQKMMMFMPIIFGVLLYSYAAGLSLYMITQSSLGIVEQRVIKKLWPIDDSELEKKEKEKKKKKGCGPFSGMMQNIAEKQRAQMKQVEAMRSAKKVQSKKQRKKKKR